jgi:hypothetical protein
MEKWQARSLPTFGLKIYGIQPKPIFFDDSVS